ncbi:MAG: HD domain-containing protein [Nitrospirae bacterium]|nr:HD domain-containing protein [Nitrospirota bacterium]
MGWIVISIAAGTIVFFIKLEEIDDFVKKLASVESRSIIDDEQVYIYSSDPQDKEYLTQILTEHIEKGHFIIVEVYDKNKEKRAEVLSPGSVKLDEYLKSIEMKKVTRHFTDEVIYNRIYFEKRIYLQVFVPLFDDSSKLIGYFEGVYHVDDNTMDDIKRIILFALLQIVVAVLATTIILYPIIMSMNKDLIKYSIELSEANVGILEALGGAIAKRDSDTHSHNYRVTIYAVRLADALGLDSETICSLIKGSFLHDAGKIAISDNILLKPDKLTEEEFSIMKTHVKHGVDIIGKNAWLQDAVDVVHYHHEKYDGTGYMSALKGHDIPLRARIFAIVDVFDALTSKRPYKEPFSYEKTMEILKQSRGSHFDPEILDVFFSISNDLYGEISKGDDAVLMHTLDRLINKYF